MKLLDIKYLMSKIKTSYPKRIRFRLQQWNQQIREHKLFSRRV